MCHCVCGYACERAAPCLPRLAPAAPAPPSPCPLPPLPHPLVARALDLLAIELRHNEGVILRHAQLHQLYLAHKQDGGVLDQALGLQKFKGVCMQGVCKVCMQGVYPRCVCGEGCRGGARAGGAQVLMLQWRPLPILATVASPHAKGRS